jgi:guanyl-specific ribonuclease Sa
LYGISRDYHNYASLLLAQIQDGGPFATPPAAVLGNCENTTNPNEKPLGYFRLSEVAEETYNIQ